jgi:hypothetical protein
VRLLLVLVVDVAYEDVVAGVEVHGQRLALADGDVLDLVDHLDPLAFLVDGAGVVGGKLGRAEVGPDHDELVRVVRTVVRDVERDVAGRSRRLAR